MKKNEKTSWNPVADWYNTLLSSKKSFFHEELILPKIVKRVSKGSVLDMACGQGILRKNLPQNITYRGVDIAPQLIKEAKKQLPQYAMQFHEKDVTASMEGLFPETQFTHVISILAVQNIDPLAPFFGNCRKYLDPKGSLHLVMNHPCFRIPRQSSWGDDTKNKIQYRRIDRYMTPLAIPIQMHPGETKKNQETLSFHRPLHLYFEELHKAGFYIAELEEWVSPKKSEGSAAKKEDRARAEFPLFLYLRAVAGK